MRAIAAAAAVLCACSPGLHDEPVAALDSALTDEEIVAGLTALFVDLPAALALDDFERRFLELDAAYRSAEPCLECDDPPPATCELSPDTLCFTLHGDDPPPPKVPSKEAVDDLGKQLKELEEAVKGDKGLKSLGKAREHVAQLRKDVQEIDKSLKKLVDAMKEKGKLDEAKRASLQRSIDLALEELDGADEALDAAEAAFKGGEKVLARAAAALKKLQAALAAMPPDKDKAAFLNLHVTKLLGEAKQLVTRAGAQMGGRGVLRMKAVADGLKAMRDQLKALMGG